MTATFAFRDREGREVALEGYEAWRGEPVMAHVGWEPVELGKAPPADFAAKLKADWPGGAEDEGEAGEIVATRGEAVKRNKLARWRIAGRELRGEGR